MRVSERTTASIGDRLYSNVRHHAGNSSIHAVTGEKRPVAVIIHKIWVVRCRDASYTVLEVVSRPDFELGPYRRFSSLGGLLFYESSDEDEESFLISAHQFVAHAGAFALPAGSFGIKSRSSITR